MPTGITRPTDLSRAFATQMRVERAVLALNQKEIRIRTGLSASMFSSFETGLKVPNLSQADLISQALGLNLTEMIRRAVERNDKKKEEST